MTEPTTKITLDRKDLMKVYFRHYNLLGAFNYERQQSSTYCHLMIPVLKKLYPDQEDFISAMKRHLAFFNCAISTAPFIIGISCAMEEEYANAPEGEFDPASINAVKAALMGPMAGIGDSFFWGTFRTIGVGVGAPMAVAGNIFGPILYFLINFIPSTITRWQGFWIGYKGGREFLTRVSDDGTLERFTEAAKILGLVVVGSMICTMVKLNIPWVVNIAGAEVVVQNILDTVMPRMMPLLLTFGCYRALNKGVKGTVIMAALFALGIVGHLIGIL